MHVSVRLERSASIELTQEILTSLMILAWPKTPNKYLPLECFLSTPICHTLPPLHVLISSTPIVSTLSHISDHWTLTSISIHGNWLAYVSSSIVISVNCVDPEPHVVALIRRHRWAKESNTNRSQNHQISVSIDQCYQVYHDQCEYQCG